MECQTTRAMCEQTATHVAITTCCSEHTPVCQMHANEGIKEWNTAWVRLGITTFTCGYCGREHMPRPTWRAI